MNILSSIAKLKWSYRKLSLPIKKNHLVLEVGSGGNPHPRSSVLVERYVSDEHRLKPIKIDERLVIADAHRLPFKAGLFDYSLAFHVLEHVDDPKTFLSELSRSSKAGYIETPNVLYERMTPFDVHLLEVSLKENKLFIRKKESKNPDPVISETKFLNRKKWRRVFELNPELFHVQYYWNGTIEYEILNPDTSTGWFIDPDEGVIDPGNNEYGTPRQYSIRGGILNWIKNRSIKTVDLSDLFVCPNCKGDLERSPTHYTCGCCKLMYSAKPVPDFINAVRLNSRDSEQPV